MKELVKKIKSNKGISLITLTVAITILMIITGTLIYNKKDTLELKNLKNMYNDIELLEDKIEAFYNKYGAIPTIVEYTNTEFLNGEDGIPDTEDDIKNSEDSDNYYVIDLASLEGITSLNYGRDYDNVKDKKEKELEEIDYTNITDLYIINEVSHQIYYVRGVQSDGRTYHTNEWRIQGDAIKNAIKKIITIKYHPNGGTGEIEDQIAIAGETVTLRESGFEKEGYSLVEWNTQDNGTGTKYDRGEKIEKGLAEDITLYAIWKEKVNVAALYIGDVWQKNYDYVQEAIDVAENELSNSEEEIKVVLLTNSTEQVTVNSTENIILDLNDKILDSVSGNTVINNGILTIINSGSSSNNGKISSNSGYGVYNTGTLTVGQEIDELGEKIIISGKTNGICNDAIFNFYNGKIIGSQTDGAIGGNVIECRDEEEVITYFENSNEVACLGHKVYLYSKDVTYNKYIPSDNSMPQLDGASSSDKNNGISGSIAINTDGITMISNHTKENASNSVSHVWTKDKQQLNNYVNYVCEGSGTVKFFLDDEKYYSQKASYDYKRNVSNGNKITIKNVTGDFYAGVETVSPQGQTNTKTGYVNYLYFETGY